MIVKNSILLIFTIIIVDINLTNFVIEPPVNMNVIPNMTQENSTPAEASEVQETGILP